MTDREAIEKMWEEQSDAAFPPDCAGAEVQGVNMIKLDARTAGCVNHFLKRNGALPVDKKTALHECLETLERILPDLTGPGKAYFERLWRLASLVQRQVGVQQGK